MAISCYEIATRLLHGVIVRLDWVARSWPDHGEIMTHCSPFMAATPLPLRSLWTFSHVSHAVCIFSTTL